MRVRLARLRHRVPKHTNALAELHGLPVKCQHDSRMRRRLELKFYFCAFSSLPLFIGASFIGCFIQLRLSAVASIVITELPLLLFFDIPTL